MTDKYYIGCKWTSSTEVPPLYLSMSNLTVYFSKYITDAVRFDSPDMAYKHVYWALQNGFITSYFEVHEEDSLVILSIMTS